MKEVSFIDGKTKIAIKDNRLAAYLENLESAGYVVKANKCKSKEGFIDILMIGRAGDFDRFFGGNARIKEISKQFPQICRVLFNGSELVLYLLAQDNR
ncbi:hypothetical protein [Candidatus Methanoperedens nitratireducens]|uniref:Uncharacterized protein n=1 Tax=Candidatus Methanoperedens nitratireducens TaxID=1392998 RepID=A0A284VSS6_9EURY|nr:hypothetical protein [Candidatus Methanoperedens nitroreducens]SNQ62336.1 hypothetical protein MNV_70008 [Candidatus Methanoperedens nitroreducens]